MTRATAASDSEPPEAKPERNGHDNENKVSADGLVDILRLKLESGHGECIYKLGDCRKYPTRINNYYYSTQFTV